MLRPRIIPVVLSRAGVVVQSKSFARYQMLGRLPAVVERLSEYEADELVLIDITPPAERRAEDENAWLSELRALAPRCRMPLTVGGGIRTLADANARLLAGADKVLITTRGLEEPSFIDAAAREFGAQAVVVGVDARPRSRADASAGWSAWRDGAQHDSGRDAVAWAAEAAARGAGEVLVQCVERDGRGEGYDLALLSAVVSSVRVPVVALGGIGGPDAWSQMAAGLRAGASGAAAANVFNYSELSVRAAKRALRAMGLPVRAPSGPAGAQAGAIGAADAAATVSPRGGEAA